MKNARITFLELAATQGAFGVLAVKVLQEGKFVNPALKSTAKRCLSSNPGKRPKLEEILEYVTI